MKQDITFITGNLQKVAWLNKYLDMSIKHHKFDLTEIQSLDVREVAKHKALEAYKQLGSPVLIDDTALTFNALGKLPGPFIKWFFEEMGNEGLCRLLDPYKDKSAYYEIVYAIYDGKRLKLFEARQEGTITEYPRANGHGWTPIFIKKGLTKTLGEMTEEEQDNTSVRKIMLKDVKAYLETL